MKNWLAALLAALLLALGAAALADVPDRPTEFAYAYDLDGGVLSDSQIEEISAYGAALEEATGAQAIAVVVDFLDGMSAADYATDLINEWGIGSADEDNGVVVLLARGDREIQIGTGKGIDRKLTGSKCGELVDENIDYFASNQFGAGMAALYADVCEYIARVEGKSLSMARAAAPAQTDSRTNNHAAAEDNSEGGLFDTILGFLIMYVIASVVINALFRGKSCCLKMFFMGWLFNRNDRMASRPYTPPAAQRHDPVPPSPSNTMPRSSGTGGLFGTGSAAPKMPRTGGWSGGSSSRSSSYGGGSSRSSSYGGGSSRSSSFGGGSSRGGGAGRSFGSSSSASKPKSRLSKSTMSKSTTSRSTSSRSSFGSSRSSFGSSSRSSGRSFGGGGSRGGGGGRKF